MSHFAAVRQAAGHLAWALWPRLCPGCEAVPATTDALGLCPACRLALWRNEGPRCRGCDGPRGRGQSCSCVLQLLVGDARYRGCRVAWHYAGPLASCIVRGKFAGARNSLQALGARMGDDAEVRRLVAGCDALVPVPPIAERLRTRGYNPASLLAGALGRACKRPVAECLVRLDAAPARSLRPRGARGGGGDKGARRPPHIAACAAPPLHPVVVDDVLTSGTTLLTVVRALLAAGAQSVGAVVAGGRPP